MGQTSREEDRLVVSGYLTAYIDLLGQKGRLAAFEKLETDSAVTPHRMAEVAQVIQQTKEFRKAFDKFYDGFASGEEFARLSKVNPPEPIVLMFSDSVVISIPFDRSPDPSQIASFYALILSCIGASVVMLENGILVRGGIAWGYGARIGEDEIIGSGLVRAYKLEQDEANCKPRIVINPGVVDPIGPFGRSFSKSSPAIDTWARVVELLPVDSDGNRFVDFLGYRTFMQVALKSDGLYVMARIDGIDRVIAEQIAPPRKRESKKDRRKRDKWIWVDHYWNQNRSHLLAGSSL